MVATIPMTPPARLVKGDSFQFMMSVPSYPATEGWVLAYALRGPVLLDVTGVAQGGNYLVSATATQGATLTAGTYTWVITVALGTQRITIDRGQLLVVDDVAAQIAGYDGRTPAKIALDQAEAALATFRSSGGVIKQYTIGDRTMVFQDQAQLLTVISYWKAKVRAEGTADSIAAGLGNPRKLHVRFG